MEVVALMRVLWRSRIATVIGAVVAVVVGVMVVRGQETHFGVASMRVILDTPNSQTVDVDPVGVTTLEWRAGLYADLVAGEPSRKLIADEMRIPGETLVVASPYMSVPVVPVPLPRVALDAAAAVPEPYQVAVQAAPPLPIIGIDARAPSREAASRLATATAHALQAATEVEQTPETQQFVIDPVGPPKARDVTNGPGKVLAVVVTTVVFCLWCAGIALVAVLANARRSRRPRRPRTAVHSPTA